MSTTLRGPRPTRRRNRALPGSVWVARGARDRGAIRECAGNGGDDRPRRASSRGTLTRRRPPAQGGLRSPFLPSKRLCSGFWARVRPFGYPHDFLNPQRFFAHRKPDSSRFPPATCRSLDRRKSCFQNGFWRASASSAFPLGELRISVNSGNWGEGANSARLGAREGGEFNSWWRRELGIQSGGESIPRAYCFDWRH